MTPLLVIAGATASGKSALAMQLAETLDGEIVSADSVQVYRAFDVGSAKPDERDRARAPHHLIDVVEPDEPFDAGRFAVLADAAIADVRARGRVPIVAGGAGLYLRALVRGLAEGIPADARVREALDARARTSPDELARMHAELARIDPAYAARIHPTDPIRIVRALEVHAISGEPISAHHARHAAMPPRYDARFVVLDPDRETIRARIAARTDTMLANGWMDEVRALLDRGVSPDVKPFGSVGYAQVLACVQGTLAERELRARIVFATTAFAKRQRTWFRGERDVTWSSAAALLAPDAVASLAEFVQRT